LLINGPISRTAEVDGEAALHAAEDMALDLAGVGEGALEPVPALLALGLLAAEDDLATLVLEAFDEHLDIVTDPDLGRLPRRAELLERHAAFRLEADVDDDDVVIKPDHGAADDAALEAGARAERLVEHGDKVVQGRTGLDGLGSFLHSGSRRRARPEAGRAAQPCGWG
jgi:hypothetical protein